MKRPGRANFVPPAICDREIGRFNATSAAKFGHIRLVLSGAAPAVAALFQEGVVWDAFIAPLTTGAGGACNPASGWRPRSLRHTTRLAVACTGEAMSTRSADGIGETG